MEQKNAIEKIKDEITGKNAIAYYMSCLPEGAGKDLEKVARRFSKIVYTAVCQNSELMKCTPASILRAAGFSASLDLDIDVRGLAYLVPYNGQASFQIGYKGLMELAYRSGKVKSISAHCIYESERENVKIARIDGRWKVEHPFSYDAPTGKMIAVYATAEIDGLGPQTMVLRTSEVEYARNLSKAKNSFAWKDHYEAMAKKTAIRRLATFLPKSVAEDLTRGAAIDDRETFVEASQTAEETIKAEMGSEVVTSFIEEDKKTEEPDFMKEID